MPEIDFTLLKELRKPTDKGRKVQNLIGRKDFGRITPLGFLGLGSHGAKWLCQCKCGTVWIVTATKLLGHSTVSCGCYGKSQIGERSLTHGMSHTRIYDLWSDMHTRCYNPNFKQFADWGGRGITVCEAFRQFENFNATLGEPPLNHQLNRVDNDGNYSCGECAECLSKNWPMNVKWSSKKEQARNTRANRMITIGDKTLCMAEWAEQCNVPYPQVVDRINNLGWSPEEALELVQRTRFLGVYTVYLTANGETRALPEWAKLRGLTKSAIRNRLARGWNHEQALGFKSSPPKRNRWDTAY